MLSCYSLVELRQLTVVERLRLPVERRLAPAIPEFEPEPDYPDLLQAPRNERTPADYMLRHQAGRAAARHERAQA